MNTNRLTISQIGTELVSAAKGQPEEVLPLSTRFFPYLYVASRHMSLRAISRWLLEKHKINLSAAAISRALNSPSLHLERLAESIEAPARYVASAYGCETMNLLFGQVQENGPSELQILANHIHREPESESDLERWQELQNLASVWEPIPHEVQLLLEPYIRDLVSDRGDDEFQDDESDPFPPTP